MSKGVLQQSEMRGHEQIVFFSYPQVGLRAIVGIHNTVLGPALGGCRMRVYTDEAQAIEDVLRLSEGMTYKSSLAGLNLGGGKSVIVADPSISGEERRKLFLKFGDCLNHLGGRYITAEDMGTGVADVMTMREITRYAAGFALENGGGGDPSPWTALGVFNSILAASEQAFGSKDLTGKRIALQGVGHVGMYLLGHLTKAGCKVTVCDTNPVALNTAKQEYGAAVVDLDAIYDVDCDIYSPNAVGQTVSAATLARLKCKIICGGANNQLTDPSVYSIIDSKNMVYCPDFVVNAGGVISVGAEYNDGGWKESWVKERVERINTTIKTVLTESVKRKKFPEVVALELAKERIKAEEERKAAR